MDPHVPPESNVTRVESSRTSVQTIDLATDGEVRDGAGDAKPSYLDHYLQLEKEEDAAKGKKSAQKGVEADKEFSPRNREDKSEKGSTKGDAAAAATAASTGVLPSRILEVDRPRVLQLAYTDEELARGTQQFFDIPDPTFYLGAALLIGCVSIFTWMAGFILDHGDIRSMYLWIITGSCAFLMLLCPFIYYLVTSKHHHICGRIWDGLCGSLPCCLAAFGVVFVYAFGIETIINTAKVSTKKAEFLIYGTIPLFLFVFFPVFFAMIKFQDKISQEIRARDPIFVKEHNYEQQPITSSGFIYLGVMLRRVIVGWVCGVCLAAHITLPAYALSWLAYGLYELQLDQGIWVIFVIVIPPILILIVLGIFKKTRIVPIVLGHMCVQWFYYPLMNWDPREGGFWYRYDNGVTFERIIDQHNSQVSRGEQAYLKRLDVESKGHYNSANDTRKLLNEKGIHYIEIDAATGEPIPNSGNAPYGAASPQSMAPASPVLPLNPEASPL